jgi:hypothetical protein
MSTTILDRTAQTVRGNRTRVVVGLGVVLVLVAAGAGVLLLTRADAASASATPPPPADAHLTQVPGLPAGATECKPVYPNVQKPYDRGARGTPETSCPFVEQVRQAYDELPPGAGARRMRVPSPYTYKWYDLECTPTGSYVTCTGGAAAIMYLYGSGG